MRPGCDGDSGEVTRSAKPDIPPVPTYDEVEKDPAALQKFNDLIVEQFRACGGTVGGPFEGLNVLLLNMTGARSGHRRLTPLEYFTIDGRLILIGSFGGAPKNPAWVHNLRAQPEARIEIGEEAFDVIADELGPDEADSLFARIGAGHPRLAAYPVPERRIPLFELRKVKTTAGGHE